jgi:hypothetical protein
MSASLTLVGCVYLIIDHHWRWHETIQYTAINGDGVITPQPAFLASGCPGAMEHFSEAPPLPRSWLALSIHVCNCASPETPSHTFSGGGTLDVARHSLPWRQRRYGSGCP